MDLQEELEYFKNNAMKLENKNGVLESEKAYIKAKNINLSEKLKKMEIENKDLRSKGLKLEEIYKTQLYTYKKQCLEEIAKVKAKNTLRREDVLECLKRHNGNKTKAAAELGRSREYIYRCLSNEKNGII